MPDLNNAKTQVFSDAHTHPDNTSAHIVTEFLNFRGDIVINMDLTEIRLAIQISTLEKVDGINYRIESLKTFNQGRFDISSVADNGGEAEFTTTLDHGLTVGDTIINRRFTESTYNGTFVVSVVGTTTTYELTGVSFVSTDTGHLVQDEADNDFTFGQQTVVASIDGSGNDVNLTFQSPVAEAASRNVPLTVRLSE